MSDYHIRLAFIDDLPALASIEIEAAKRFLGTGLVDHLRETSFDPASLKALIDCKQVWLACEPDNTPVGFIVVSVRGVIAYLEEMDVLPAHGRRGLGSSLVSTAKEWALDKGLEALILSTFESIPWNAPFYERLGFTVVPEELWSEDMLHLRAEEQERGLPLDKRVIMKLEI